MFLGEFDMEHRLRPYLATARMSALEQNYFGLGEAIGGYAIRALRLIALISLWTALFSQGAQTEGMTLPMLLSYTAVSVAFSDLLDVRTPASSWMHEGSILSQYMRPMGIFPQLAAHTAGGWITPFLLFSLPVLIISAILGINVLPQSPWFFVSLALSVSLGFAIDFLFACLVIRMQNAAWLVEVIRRAITALLSGAVIPFALFPWGIGSILALSPFASQAGASLSLFTGLADAKEVLPLQVFWNLLLWPATLLLFNRSRERMVSHGG
jgi:ABC-2 type transport system permease protein